MNSNILLRKIGEPEVIVEQEFSYEAYIIFVRHIYGDEVRLVMKKYNVFFSYFECRLFKVFLVNCLCFLGKQPLREEEITYSVRLSGVTSQVDERLSLLGHQS